jgi:UrcA family protein
MPKMMFAAAAAVALLAGPALADQDQATVVHTGRVNFTDPAQVQAFYAKITAVARDVCSAHSPDRIFARAAPDPDCVARALAQAVRQIDQPVLTAAYDRSKTEDKLSPAKGLAINEQ